ncbi:MAG: hypothetical protein IIZ59_02100 [Clostridia bacterium]|nr:hypothetical protein [Clostridia bacterium]
MKKRVLAFAAAMVMLLGGCGKSSKYGDTFDFTMPASPTEFNLKAVYASSENENGSAGFDYNGRTYVMYGELDGELTSSDVGACLGYVVQDGVKVEAIRIFALASDSDMNFLVSADSEGVMEKPLFYRAADTADSDITIPSFIKDLGQDYWK